MMVREIREFIYYKKIKKIIYLWPSGNAATAAW